MARFSKEFDGQGEDQLTISLIIQLNNMGLGAEHDATSGGHCDIVVKGPANFLWLGEAKKVEGIDNAHISGGYDQLTMRYATGLPSQDRGSLIIFCNCERSDRVIASWREYLAKRYDEAVVGELDASSQTFVSSQESIRTGADYTVRHKPISVYFPPSHGVTSTKSKPAAASPKAK